MTFSATIRYGGLRDPDNYLYLVQAIDGLRGQGWYDLIQHRMNPPEGTALHYSHILSAFYGILIFLLRPLLGLTQAALATAAFAPLLFFGAFLLVYKRLAQAVIDKEWGDITAYYILFSIYVLSRLLPGHIDHHGVVLLLSMTAFYYMIGSVLRPQNIQGAALAGAALALALALSLESLVAIVLYCLWFGLWAMAEGGAATRSGAVFGTSFFVGSAVLLMATRPLGNFFDVDLLAYSIVYVVFSACIALCFAGMALAKENAPVFVRAGIGGSLACITGVLFFAFFPELRGGPYAAVNPELSKIILTNASEAWPIIRPESGVFETLYPLFMPSLALGAGLFLFAKTPQQKYRWLWGGICFALAVFLGLSAFSQRRFLIYADVFALLPMTAMVAREYAQRPGRTFLRRAKRALTLAAFLPVWLVVALMIAAFIPSSSANNTMHSQTQNSISAAQTALMNALNDGQRYGNRPRIILNSISTGPALLFWTPHKVLAGPYHTNVEGNLDAFRFFTATDPKEARAIAQKRYIDLVVVDANDYELKIYKGKNENSKNASLPFIRQLIAGQIPAWLKPVNVVGKESFLLFEIAAPTARKK